MKLQESELEVFILLKRISCTLGAVVVVKEEFLVFLQLLLKKLHLIVDETLRLCIVSDYDMISIRKTYNF